MPPKRFRLVSAVHVFLIHDGRVLLLCRRHTGYEDGNCSVVAGHMDGGEEMVAAAGREAREEIGVAVPPDELRVVGVMHRRGERGRSGDERIGFFLEATRWEGWLSTESRGTATSSAGRTGSGCRRT